MSVIKKLKEQFNTRTQLIKRLLEVIEYKKSNDILANMVIERRGQKITKLVKEVEVFLGNGIHSSCAGFPIKQTNHQDQKKFFLYHGRYFFQLIIHRPIKTLLKNVFNLVLILQ